MADTRFFRSASGVIYEMDVPAVGSMRRERHDEKVANGELVELIGVTPVRVDVDDTSYRWELPKGTAPAAIPAPEPVDLLEDDAPAADDGDDPAIDGDDVPDGTIGDILAWVDDDPTRAGMALAVELAGKARSSLTSQLQAVIDG